MILLAHSGGHIIQGGRVIGRGFLLARREAGFTEFVVAHLDNIFAVFGCTMLLLLALLLLVPWLLSGVTSGLTDTVTSV